MDGTFCTLKYSHEVTQPTGGRANKRNRAQCISVCGKKGWCERKEVQIEKKGGDE